MEVTLVKSPPVRLQGPALARFELGCPLPEISLVDWLKYCCTGELPSVVCSALQKGGFLADLIRFHALVGTLEPRCAREPGVCDPSIVVDKEVTVPVATLNPDGTVMPSEVRVVSFCAPLNRALVVEESRVTAVNAAAAAQPFTQPVYKRFNLGTFGEFCLSFEPGDMPGQFVNTEHIIVPPAGGYSIFVQNFDIANVAIYRFHALMWACC